MGRNSSLLKDYNYFVTKKNEQLTWLFSFYNVVFTIRSFKTFTKAYAEQSLLIYCIFHIHVYDACMLLILEETLKAKWLDFQAEAESLDSASDSKWR